MRYVEAFATGEYEEKKSRFIGEIYPVKGEEEIPEILGAVRKKYYDARHHCYAYVLGEHYEIVKQSDDGEPSQTAGMPILNVLKGEDIHDALIVVTRYFGGTLLGTGGLVRSYTQAAREAVRSAVLLEACTGFRASAEIPYTLVGKVKYITESLGITEENAEYGTGVRMTWLVPDECRESFEKKLTDASAGSITLDFEPARWYNR